MIFTRFGTTLCLCIAAVFASGCAYTPDTSIQFDNNSAKAIVIGSLDTKQNPTFNGGLLQFSPYDKSTQRLLPDKKFFIIFGEPFLDGPDLQIVEPGNYVLTHKRLTRESGSPKILRELIASEDRSALHGVQRDARVGGIKAYRVDIQPGEVIYLGAFVHTAFAPKWINRQDELDALMAQMKHVSVKPVFRPPTLRTE